MLFRSVSTLCCWLNWGFGLIVGALLAKEVARRVNDVDYPLLIASAYSGFVIWHAGLSGSIPLQMAAEGGKEFLGVVYQAPLTQLRFTCGMTLSQGQRLAVSVWQPPLLEDLPIQVELPVDFGEGATGSYRCRILDLPGENGPRLEKYLRDLSLRVNKSFPPLPED